MKINKISAIKYLVGFIFLFSAVSKLFPVLAFEMQLVSHGITNWLAAVVLARVLIAAEIFLGLCFFQHSYIKKIFIPGAMLLLIIFSIDMIYLIILRGPGGSCGCFGSVLTMTPIEALIKNIILLALLNFLYNKIKADTGSGTVLVIIFFVLSVSITLLFSHVTHFVIEKV